MISIPISNCQLLTDEQMVHFLKLKENHSGTATPLDSWRAVEQMCFGHKNALSLEKPAPFQTECASSRDV